MKRFNIVLFVILSFTFSIFAQNSQIKLEGTVVCCADCWAEKDRTKIAYGNAEDLLRAKSCVEGGDPTLLAVRREKDFKLYQLAEGKFRLTEKNWLSFVGKKISVVGKKISVAGNVKKTKKAEIIQVDTLEVLERSLAEQDAAQVLGTQVELKLKDLFGVEQSLAQFKGRIVVLNFWATYCVPCRKEMPDLSAIQNEYAALGVQVIGASTDEAEDRAKVLQFIKDVKINFPVWVGATSQDLLRFGVGTALPATIIIDREGKTVKMISGIVNLTDLKKDIDAMLKSDEKKQQKEIKTQAKISEAETSSVPS
ncbi:MAG TPA: TlpA disulfide reductase family protein [Pyrinomonadaceae bacterium]|nr:TlpA disulfide reductase family protein [Pyrinomonadaceae bacterium]